MWKTGLCGCGVQVLSCQPINAGTHCVTVCDVVGYSQETSCVMAVDVVGYSQENLYSQINRHTDIRRSRGKLHTS